LYYKIIYNNFVKDEVIENTTRERKKEIKGLFWYFFSVWSIYGIAALFPYKEKNISYNILDLFSKNFFGLFLSYKVYVNKKSL
jgi:bacteriorhodopsin